MTQYSHLKQNAPKEGEPKFVHQLTLQAFLRASFFFFIFLNILIIAKVEAISLPTIIYCQEATHPRHKNQRFIFVNQRSRQGGDVLFCHYFVILRHLWPSQHIHRHINAFAVPLFAEYVPDTWNKFPEIKIMQIKEIRNAWKGPQRARN